ncbi:hypothetical protein EU97_1958 [Prochlorococcus marinus str. MIT 9311]|nr:hypothetical protein EU97_1958 [Prochlorococcus marinus str. MIT 9311]
MRATLCLGMARIVIIEDRENNIFPTKFPKALKPFFKEEI